MAALVVTVSPANGMGDTEGRIGIFPGGATTTMYPADTPFWVGYGFAADSEGDTGLDEATTRFELDVDGQAVSMRTDLHTDAGLPVRKTNIAEFPEGLPAGWHDFSGRWYDGGRLILSSRAAIQFVDR
ncbi:MAG TPA: hypothetical protein VHI53_13430 [Gaiellaceae bacterium]|jgi:hypothetical protein|nr:hypothetical protein [Gaiellaceae bacterium]